MRLARVPALPRLLRARMRERRAQAQVIVVNHTLLLLDAA